ncbi:MAG: 50S ribosomal protein L25 [Candidatus Pacebacteria bacterium]|nr:50S ribosomal protein L25 [Candidatus Paceibacterota bacterium]MBP9700850.1 50S ribosomal protein L25 [Candidatus Paceibacterota bacterium]
MITLAATKRTNESPAAVRAADNIPAVYYGTGKEAVSISVPMREFVKVWKEAGETAAVALDFGGEKVTTLIHDMQYDPITNAPTHIDFLVIDMKKEIEVAVPIEFTGLADAEKGNIGTLVKVLHEVEVRALPNDMPQNFEIDVTPLASLDAQIHVKDIVLPKGVTMITDGEEVIALIAAFKEEKEEEAAPIDLDAIEVEKKGKKEDDEAPAAE